MHRRIGSTVDAVVVAAVAVAVIIGGTTSGCSRSSDASTTPQTTVGSTPDTIEIEDTTSTTVMTDEEAILSAVAGYWMILSTAGDPPNPDHPKISQFAADEASTRIVERLTEVRSLNQVIRDPKPSVFSSNPSITSIDGDTALVVDCIVDDSQLIDATTGEILDSDIGTIQFSLGLRRIDGSWKVATNEIIAEWEGAGQCT